jgi:hypothetical protein
MLPFVLIQKVFAQEDWCQRHPEECGLNEASPIIGKVLNPLTYGSFQVGLVPFFNNVLRLVFVVAGIYALLNFIVAGYQYMTAGGDSKMLAAAWNKIWQSLLGLLIIVGSFVLAGIFGQLFFGDAGFILNPTIYGP